MKKLFKIAKLYQKRIASLVPALEMATAFGRVMGSLLGENPSDIADLVAPALKRASQEDLQNYNLSQQKRIAKLFYYIIKADGPEYAKREMQQQDMRNYDMEESLSWIAQEVLAKARGQYDNERRFGPEGRFM